MKDEKGVAEGYWAATSHYTCKLLLRIESRKESNLSMKRVQSILICPLKGANERMLVTITCHESEYITLISDSNGRVHSKLLLTKSLLCAKHGGRPL